MISDNVITLMIDVDGNIVVIATSEATGTDRPSYTITVSDENLEVTPDEVYHGIGGLEITVSAKDGYRLVEITSVTMGETLLTEGVDGGYTVTDNVITILMEAFGDIYIVATSEATDPYRPDWYSVTVTDDNLEVTPDEAYHGESDLQITVSAKDGYRLVEITSVTMGNALLVYGEGGDYMISDNVITLMIDVDGNIVVIATSEAIVTYEEPDVYTITIFSDEGRSFRYSVDGGASWIEFIMDESGRKNIEVEEGCPFWIEATDNGYTVKWIDDARRTVSEGMEFRMDNVGADLELTALFAIPERHGINIPLVLALLFTFLLIAMFIRYKRTYGQ